MTSRSTEPAAPAASSSLAGSSTTRSAAAGSTEASWAPPIGAARGRRVRYELLGCAVAGHAVPFYDAPTHVEDPALVRDLGGLRWHRCLRCDAWIPAPAASDPAEPDGRSWSREQVTVPIRGRLLRDRYVLRVIALDRAVHVLVLAALAAAIILFTRHRTGLQARVTRIVADLQGGVGGPIHDTGHGIAHDVDRLFALGTGSLLAAAAVVIAYAVLEAVEMVGLWFARRWAEYLTFIATIGLLPLEIYELTGQVSVLKLITLAINLAIAVYLLLAKRLFGLRGGGRREDEERARDSGWLPIDRATPTA